MKLVADNFIYIINKPAKQRDNMNLDTIVKNQTNNIRSRSNLRNIGIDIDNTLFYIPIVEYINEKYGESYTHYDVNDWNFSNFPEHIREDIFAQFKNPEFMCHLKPIYGAFQTIRDWHSVGHKIYLITSRDFSIRRQTEDLIRKEFLDLVEDVGFVGQDNKKAALKYYRITDFIDDYCVEDGLDLKINTWMITNNRTIYNHSKRTDLRLNQAESLRNVRLLNDARAIIH